MAQLWVFVSLLSAMGDAARDFSAKRVLTKGNSMLFTWLIFVLPLPVIYAADFFYGIPHPAPGFYSAIFSAVPLEILAQILYMQALRLSPLSIVAPLLSLTPVFMLVVPFLIIGEKISMVGGSGVLLVAGGAYILNVDAVKKGILEPFRALFRERGAVYMCIVAMLFSFTATLSKKAISLSSPLHYMAVYWTCLVIGMSPLVLRTYRGRWNEMREEGAVGKAIIPSILFLLAVFAAAYSLSIAKVTYVITIKRLSALFSIALAGAFLKEEHIRERLTGAVLMLSGFALIVLFA
ncbi:MAG TPA: EamA family transporter [Geobacteraceae bacterium]|jgi:drug/metabolite transporter (DMT)-like permease|nr:EamA family transporter [Geobacteraceae bacterium]